MSSLLCALIRHERNLCILLKSWMLFQWQEVVSAPVDRNKTQVQMLSQREETLGERWSLIHRASFSNITCSGQIATSSFTGSSHGVLSLLIWLSPERVMTHKMIAWFLIFNPNSWLIDGSFSLPLYLDAKNSVKGEICVEKHSLWRAIWSTSSESLTIRPSRTAPSPGAWQVGMNAPSHVLLHRRLSTRLSLLLSQMYQCRQWPNRCWDSAGSVYSDFMFISLSYSQTDGCCLPWLNSGSAHNRDILLCIYSQVMAATPAKLSIQ